MTHEHWSSRLDYFFTLLGWAMGTGPMFRGPFLWIRSGGGVFFIPYLLCTLLCAVPMVYLEMVIGQYSQAGLINTFNFCPPLKGIGVATMVMVAMFSLYYPIYMTWSLMYLAHSFQTPLPWTTCNNWWNTPACHERGIIGSIASQRNGSHIGQNGSWFPHNQSELSVWKMALVDELNNSATGNSSTTDFPKTSQVENSAADEFWSYKILQMSGGIEEVGGMNWPLLAVHTALFLFFFICLVKGIKILGKIVYVTYLVPFLMLLAIFVRMCTLKGGLNGIAFMWRPNLHKLADPNVWLEGWQVALYSYGIAMGVIITMAGHNRFKKPILKNLLILVPANVAGEVFAIMTVLTIMGYVADSRGCSMEQFQFSGMKLSFIAFSEALSTLPFPQVWSPTFFLTAVMLGVDSVLPALEVIMAGIEDLFPSLQNRRTLLTILVVVPCYLPGLLFSTQGSIYYLTIVDWFAVFPAMLLIAILECVAISWIYGWDRLCEDIASMTGSGPPRVMKYFWMILVPLQLLVILVNSCYSYRPPRYGSYVFPPLANVFGWMISLSTILPIPVLLVWSLRHTVGRGWLKKVRKQFQPNAAWRIIPKEPPSSTGTEECHLKEADLDELENMTSLLSHQGENQLHHDRENGHSFL